MISLICGIFKKKANNDPDELTYKTNRLTDFEKELTVVEGKDGGRPS